jgi:hypothetical protein
VNLEAGFAAGLGQGFEEIMAIAVIAKDRCPPISPAQDMIDCAWILNAHLPWHQSILPQTTEAGKDKIEHIHGLTPLTCNVWRVQVHCIIDERVA